MRRDSQHIFRRGLRFAAHISYEARTARRFRNPAPMRRCSDFVSNTIGQVLPGRFPRVTMVALTAHGRDRPDSNPVDMLATRSSKHDDAAVSAESLVGLPLIRQWIAYDTTSRESNLALIEWSRHYLESFGALTSLTFDDERRKANLFATLPARDGNTSVDGIVLSGHTDVVPVDGQPWDTPPFEATLKSDRLYGRGTADNKGQHSINMSALRAVREARGGKLGFNAKFIIETGEEIGSPDLRQVCESLRDELKADLFLASDGPRLSADRPTIFLGCRGGIRIHLDVNLRDGGHHSDEATTGGQAFRRPPWTRFREADDKRSTLHLANARVGSAPRRRRRQARYSGRRDIS